ncbi:unnamed protein product [Citrullus colocynthis]|uniref:Uncharacterized protein n=1 Tax=Citrullus colocynthis TaxID=252529 RepID=A0ABP0Y1G4_9ROSI
MPAIFTTSLLSLSLSFFLDQTSPILILILRFLYTFYFPSLYKKASFSLLSLLSLFLSNNPISVLLSPFFFFFFFFFFFSSSQIIYRHKTQFRYL